MGKKSGYKSYKAFPILKSQGNKITKNEKKSKKKKEGGNKKKSYLNIQPNKIQCKIKRQEIVEKRKHELTKQKKKMKLQRKQENEQTGQKPLEQVTIEDKREIDENFVFEEDEELQNEEKFDEFQDYFDSKVTPKILMTTCEKPKATMFSFLKEIKDTFPNCQFWPRQNYNLKEICQYAQTKEYTDIMVWRGNRGEMDELVMIHLPKGPTIHFKVSSIQLNEDIEHHANSTEHYPELILNNFNTKIGRRVGRFFGSLFPQKPEFKGRQVVTLLNKRDFIFFRRHRYIFKEEGTKVGLQEIGPKFTLKLTKIQLGVFDNVNGKVEFQAKDDMYVSRKKTFI